MAAAGHTQPLGSLLPRCPQCPRPRAQVGGSVRAGAGVPQCLTPRRCSWLQTRFPEEEEPVLLERGLRDVEEAPEQLHHVGAHQPGRRKRPRTASAGGALRQAAASPWGKRCSPSTLPPQAGMVAPRPPSPQRLGAGGRENE